MQEKGRGKWGGREKMEKAGGVGLESERGVPGEMFKTVMASRP